MIEEIILLVNPCQPFIAGLNKSQQLLKTITIDLNGCATLIETFIDLVEKVESEERERLKLISSDNAIKVV